MMRNMACQITDLLSQKKMTQKELALKTGITESSISHYVKGNREPRGANLTKNSRSVRKRRQIICYGMRATALDIIMTCMK